MILVDSCHKIACQSRDYQNWQVYNLNMRSYIKIKNSVLCIFCSLQQADIQQYHHTAKKVEGNFDTCVPQFLNVSVLEYKMNNYYFFIFILFVSIDNLKKELDKGKLSSIV